MTKFGGAMRDRTADLNAASVALSQLSYGPNVSSGAYIIELPPTSQVFCYLFRSLTNLGKHSLILFFYSLGFFLREATQDV